MAADLTPPPSADANGPDADPTTAGLTVVEQDDGRIVVHVHGDLDAVSSPGLRTALIEIVERRPSVLVIDMAGVDFLDSAGISALVVAHNRGVDAGVAIELAAVPIGCQRVLEITSLADIFTIVD